MQVIVPRRNAVATPATMPIYYRHGSSIVNGSYSSVTDYRATATPFFSSYVATDGFTYAYTSTASTGGTWYTLVNITSGKGKFAGAVSNTSATVASTTVSLRITIDGKAYTFNRVTSLASYRLCMGVFIPIGQYYNSLGTETVSQNTTSLFGGGGSPATFGEYHIYQAPCSTIIERAYDKLPSFKSSLKVETLCSLNSSAASSYASALYILE